MKKYILAFIAFCAAFFAALAFICFKANPAVMLSDEHMVLEWHGKIENEYGTYNGALIGEIFSGKGSFDFLSGETYAGEWQDSFMAGNGTIIFPEIGNYTGEMSESKRNGQGTFIWISGDKYEGGWVNDTMSGKGKYSFTDGGLFDGTFENNKPTSGTYTFEVNLAQSTADTDICYLKYTFNEAEKHIEFHTKGGLKYNGDISALFGSGSASITYPSGNIYDGDLYVGQRQGKGKYTWKDSTGDVTAYYDGSWYLDSMDGQGEYHYSSSIYPYLSGSFNKNVPYGTLTYYKESENTFETKWEDGICTDVKET